MPVMDGLSVTLLTETYGTPSVCQTHANGRTIQQIYATPGNQFQVSVEIEDYVARAPEDDFIVTIEYYDTRLNSQTWRIHKKAALQKKHVFEALTSWNEDGVPRASPFKIPAPSKRSSDGLGHNATSPATPTSPGIFVRIFQGNIDHKPAQPRGRRRSLIPPAYSWPLLNAKVVAIIDPERLHPQSLERQWVFEFRVLTEVERAPHMGHVSSFLQLSGYRSYGLSNEGSTHTTAREPVKTVPIQHRNDDQRPTRTAFEDESIPENSDAPSIAEQMVLKSRTTTTPRHASPLAIAHNLHEAQPNLVTGSSYREHSTIESSPHRADTPLQDDFIPLDLLRFDERPTRKAKQQGLERIRHLSQDAIAYEKERRQGRYDDIDARYRTTSADHYRDWNPRRLRRKKSSDPGRVKPQQNASRGRRGLEMFYGSLDNDELEEEMDDEIEDEGTKNEGEYDDEDEDESQDEGSAPRVQIPQHTSAEGDALEGQECDDPMSGSRSDENEHDEMGERNLFGSPMSVDRGPSILSSPQDQTHTELFSSLSSSSSAPRAQKRKRHANSRVLPSSDDERSPSPRKRSEPFLDISHNYLAATSSSIDFEHPEGPSCSNHLSHEYHQDCHDDEEEPLLIKAETSDMEEEKTVKQRKMELQAQELEYRKDPVSLAPKAEHSGVENGGNSNEHPSEGAENQEGSEEADHTANQSHVSAVNDERYSQVSPQSGLAEHTIPETGVEAVYPPTPATLPDGDVTQAEIEKHSDILYKEDVERDLRRQIREIERKAMLLELEELDVRRKRIEIESKKVVLTKHLLDLDDEARN
ncbi:Hypothetical predicted protein [Lecanosticta acicola]|uniref:Uncharacterized protein n=1 Tax=Lecanosticta acicola TaxID=111012 RepID=A0AAI8Z7G6_9PEZI|nr:Hypothetical predicted protein [Lecanosticta acicola]